MYHYELMVAQHYRSTYGALIQQIQLLTYSYSGSTVRTRDQTVLRSTGHLIKYFYYRISFYRSQCLLGQKLMVVFVPYYNSSLPHPLVNCNYLKFPLEQHSRGGREDRNFKLSTIYSSTLPDVYCGLTFLHCTLSFPFRK